VNPMGMDTPNRDATNAIFLEISRHPVDWTHWGSMSVRLVVEMVVVDLQALCYSAAQIRETMQNATVDCLVEAVFG
jgi:hypothetical protein